MDDKHDQEKLLDLHQNILTTLNENETITTKGAISSVTEIALPTILYMVCIFFKQTINLIFITRYYTGQLQEYATEAVGLSHLYINCLLLSLTIGLISGFDTLGANAYGSGKFRLMGSYFHRAQLIAYCFIIISLIIHFFAGPALLALTTNHEEVKSFITQYLRVAMFMVLLEVPCELNARFIYIIDKPMANFISVIASLLLHPLWCYLFIIVFNFEIIGAGIALIVSNLFLAMCGSIYIYIFKPLPEAIFWFNKKSFKGWGKYLKFTLPTCTDWWSQEILAIIAVLISDDDYFAYVLLANIVINCYSMCHSFGFAINILIASFLGQGDIKSTITVRNTGLIYGVSFVGIVSFILFCIKTYVIGMFSVPERLLPLCYKLMDLLCIFIIFDVFQTMLGGTLRGYGKQFLASMISIPNYYILQVGLAYLLGIHFKLGVVGIYFSLVTCAATMGIIYSFVIFCFIDLKNIKFDTLNRLESDALDLSFSSSRSHKY
jgi:MATE family multidrug resistance protein